MTGKQSPSTNDRSYRVTTVEELSEEGMRVITDIRGREIAVFRIGKEFHAVLNYCPHEAGPLCEGNLAGRMTIEDGCWAYDEDASVIVCPWHAWQFDIDTGQNVQDDRYAVPTYETKVVDGEIFVTL